MQPKNQGFHGQWRENAENESTPAWVDSLLEKLSTGDRTAFWPLWEQYQDYLYHRCCSWMGGNRSQAQDALSEIMLKAWEKLPKFAAKITNLKGWLTKFAHNFCIDCHRENNSGAIGLENLEAIAVAEGNGLVTEFDTPGKIVEKRELLEVIRSALEDLPENQREVCLLHFEQELSYQEIAQRLDISNDSVRKRIQRAREKLQPSLQTYLAGLDEKAYGDIAFKKEIRRVSEQQSKEEKDRESNLTPADKEKEQGNLQTTEQSESLTEMGISEDGEIFNKGNYPQIRLETTAKKITSLVEPELAALLNLLLNNSRVGILPARKGCNGQDAHSTKISNGQDAHSTKISNGQDAHSTKISNGQDAHSTKIPIPPRSQTGKMPIPPRCPFHQDLEGARCPFYLSLKIIPLLSNAFNPLSTKLTDSNAWAMDWVKPRSLKPIAISPASLGHGSQEVSRWQDLSQLPIPIVARISSKWGNLTKKVQLRSNHKLYTGDRGPPEY
ncbi:MULTISPECIES: sigma-70 family RNA polymerase sigma factor [unclassified Moorena]|uniref:RNA polymerase sigma factor n=1 Tax=unclassified Moorena TaxID=2683338 RepID=UPI0013B7200C|nr:MULTISPECIES: sigma-70 family RNA polymerase sigma factor [unclassified Moorena]NEP35530.1 sigma-70 family RNA polymerase sigma factor [Moorena sp. SIO3B2]NEQ06732.1 sigma-70 family RNA polymerase sigma factor [Moorena sp. SIO4E2]